MRLLVLSHKETWTDPASPTGYATIGGFPLQMQALSELFEQTTLLLPIRRSNMPNGATPLVGNHLSVIPLPEPAGTNFHRKISLLNWAPRNLSKIWRMVQQADAIHIPVPGDIGTIGILVALFQQKPLFVRYCGTWGEPISLVNRFLFWLMEGVAGGRNIVLATGGSDVPPSSKNSNIRWLFSTTLTEAELESLPVVYPWKPGEPFRLVTVARLTVEKNVESIIRALPILSSFTEEEVRVNLHIVGDGEMRLTLEQLVQELGLQQLVTFHGNLSHIEVMHILSHSHLFVFPTRVKEGFPKAVLEALACGLPVVATNISVIPSLIKDCGTVLTDANPQAVAEAVHNLVADPQRLVEMSTLARERAQHYTLERWQDEIRSHLSHFWNA